MIGFEAAIEWTILAIEAAGIAVIVIGALWFTGLFLNQLRRGEDRLQAYRLYRVGVGRGILLGLEFLVAAEIIRTVAIARTFESVGVLAAIILIRTFLSLVLELELEGRWPWQRSRPVRLPEE